MGMADRRSMRILHILDHGLPLQSGYAYRTRAILKAQEARGHRVAAVTGPRQGACKDLVEREAGLDFHRTDAERAPGLLGEARSLAAFARRIATAADGFRPDLIHAHSPVLGGLAAWRVARCLGVPLVYEIRAFWEDAAAGNGTGRARSARYHATRTAESWMARRADAVAVICDGLRRDLIARGIDPARILVVPNGVDLDRFATPGPRDAKLAAALGLDDAETIGFIGSFYPYEGIDDLIAAMPVLIASRPRARLLLVGGGPAEAALRAQAAASPVADRIGFVGRVPHDVVEHYYGLVDILVYPRKAMRLTELVTPLKPLEAMAQGRLVAASDVGGHRELIDHGVTGTLFAPGDPAAIAQALAAMLADRSGWAEHRTAARAHVRRTRGWTQIVDRYDSVYHSLVERSTMDRSCQSLPVHA